MAQFRGTLKGQRGEASRLGSKSSGLTVDAATWTASFSVQLSMVDGIEWANVTARALGSHTGHRVLYDGPAQFWTAAGARKVA